MTGFGSPYGACKFLRRKCWRGCVFASYYCQKQGAKHFAAIHKVFGASNVLKLRMHHPANHHSEAAISISYEAQIVNHQAQLASLKAQAVQGLGNGSGATFTPQEDKLYQKFPPCQQDGQVYNPHSGLNDEGVSFGIEDDTSCAMATLSRTCNQTPGLHHIMKWRTFNQ